MVTINATKLIQYGAAGAAVLLFVLVMLGAWHNGQARAQGAVVVRNAAAYRSALGYFMADQSRYPTPLEFADAGSFGRYLNPFPAIEFHSQRCSGSLTYKSAALTSFQLFMCLPLGVQSFPSGWSLAAQTAS